MYCEGRFKKYLNDLAAKEPAPRGGSATAYGLEPEFASQISMGALPLWRQQRCPSPRRPGGASPPNPLRFEPCQ